MSAVSTAADIASIDWNIVAGAVGTFVVTVLVSWQGFRKGKKKVEAGQSEITPIVGASLIENAAMKNLALELHSNSEEMRRLTAAITRQSDIMLLTHRD